MDDHNKILNIFNLFYCFESTGSVIGSHFHRQALAALNYITDTVALVSGFAIVPLNNSVIGISVGIILGGFAFYGFITLLGGRLMKVVLVEQEAIKAKDYENIEIGIIGNEIAEP